MGDGGANPNPYGSTSAASGVTPASYMPGSTRSFSETQPASDAYNYPNTASNLSAPSPTAGMR
jgi:hypothetical protein